MLTSSPPKKDATATSASRQLDPVSNDLKFISELGRSLLMAVHPKKVASRVAEAIQQGVGADVCVFVVELENIGLISCASKNGELIDESLLDRARIERWLAFMPPQIGYTEDTSSEFLIENGEHAIEYVSPLHINGEIRGAIITGFNSSAELTDNTSRLIDAATQMAAMSVNLTSHYESAINSSISEARAEHRRFTEAVLDSLPVSIYVVDRDYRIVTWNRHREEGEQGIPREAAIGRDVFSVLEKYPQGRLKQEFERAFRTGKIERIEQQTVADDGSTRHWMVSKVPMRDPDSGDVTHVITIGEDVTVRVEAIHAISRAEKLAAVGRLAAGIVHEINNPLATIAACAESLEQRIDDGEFSSSASEADLAEYLGLIKSEAFRCKSITTGLLDFSRIRTGERESVDAGDIVRSAANLVSHQKRGNGIIQNVEIDSHLPLVSADAGQIQQAIIALATNAIDAMPLGGTLTFRVAPHGNRVLIEIKDTGEGIRPENMSKVFEPFFTTKEVGKGTGLGLAVCYGIISEHDGRLSVRSNVGKGTTFSIFLPAVRD
ncbi:MAG: PAS domain-containing protein [Acidobacteria bacterium]|nr:PAS domain-containing protein [Acidobacteriota bacterium]